ncbi:MAG: hypothetical protein LAT66_12920, partial [Alkalimonas sp.]|nr:hypothetical protein [Alkalimonas sp.]
MNGVIYNALALSLALLGLIGCAASTTTVQSKITPEGYRAIQPAFFDIPINKQLFPAEDAYQMPSPDELFWLPEHVQTEFLRFYHDEARQHEAPDRRLLSFIERRYGDFNYFGKTLKAAETLQGEAGNCMSLAVLTTAYANLIDVRLSYQMVYSAPVYELVDDTLFVSSHVRTRVSSPTQIDQASGQYSFSHSYIDYFPTSGRTRGQRISEPLFISMYYQNVAAELLQQGLNHKAFTYLKKALKIAPENVAALNSLAVLHRRQHDDTTAEQLYRYALQNYPTNLSVAVNFRDMLLQQGRVDEAATLDETIAQIDDPNPYEWIALAQESIRLNRLTRAERYLQRAEQLAPYLDELYFQYARIDFLRGHTGSAQRHLVTAQ